MAHLWVATEENKWAVMPLEDEGFSLSENPPRAARRTTSDSEVFPGVLLVRSHARDGAVWVLLARPGSGVRVNGFPLATGMRVVSDRDEIRVPEVGSVYFSTESLARIDEFCGSDQILFCPRCKQEIQQGTTAVKCPACGVWHHEADELNCWTYSEVCALCAQTTDLDSGFNWTPEDL
jgi:hypothetical protein